MDTETAQVWDLENVRLMATLHDAPNALESAAFTSDNRRLLTMGRFSPALTWWDSSGVRLGTAAVHEGSISTWDYNEAADTILTVGSDRTARIWKPFLRLVKTFPESSTTQRSGLRTGGSC